MTISVQTHMLKVNYFLRIGKQMWLFSADRALMEKTRVPRVERSNTVKFWFDICGVQKSGIAQNVDACIGTAHSNVGKW